MDRQDILKAILDDASSTPDSAFVKFLEKQAISSTKEDPIDRQEAYDNDALDFFEKIVTTFIRQYPVFFVNPDTCCESFRLAIASEKLRVHQQANEARKMRDEHQASGGWVYSIEAPSYCPFFFLSMLPQAWKLVKFCYNSASKFDLCQRQNRLSSG